MGNTSFIFVAPSLDGGYRLLEQIYYTDERCIFLEEEKELGHYETLDAAIDAAENIHTGDLPSTHIIVSRRCGLDTV